MWAALVWNLQNNMKQLVYKELKRLYPNAIGFSFCTTQYGNFYFAENVNGREDITEVLKEICRQIALAKLIKEVENWV